MSGDENKRPKEPFNKAAQNSKSPPRERPPKGSDGVPVKSPDNRPMPPSGAAENILNSDKSKLDKPPFKPQNPYPQLVPHGVMAKTRLAVLRDTREAEMIKHSKQKFEKERADKVHSKDLSKTFNDRSR